MVLEEASFGFADTKFGPAPVGSPLVYQQSPSLQDRSVWMSPNIALTRAKASSIPVPPLLFQESTEYEVPTLTDISHANILRSIALTKAAALELEKNTQQQSKSDRWLAAQQYRLTASKFGLVMRRENWTQQRLHNLTAHKDLSRCRPVAYGRKHEDTAAEHYCRALQNLGHDIVVSHCGIAVHPSCPWLGASPDRFVFDPEESPPHGVLEIKCPYSLRDSELEHAKSELKQMQSDEGGHPMVKRESDYYYQILGQMAITGLKWGDFVVFSEKFMIVERIYFDEDKWKNAKRKLDYFYFNHLLPYFSKN
ncbi:uncharacterized protein LOC135374166 [Ornithodoros turicata]|uniref:uncharacterized protein LOC135374166 n=1 Tax=Ornithodoros turicata TaxID=34597 RepID=UPI003138823E